MDGGHANCGCAGEKLDKRKDRPHSEKLLEKFQIGYTAINSLNDENKRNSTYNTSKRNQMNLPTTSLETLITK